MGNPERETRREIIKKAVYVAPAILTLTASPAFAQNGPGRPDKLDKDKDKDKDKGYDKGNKDKRDKRARCHEPPLREAHRSPDRGAGAPRGLLHISAGVTGAGYAGALT